MEGITDSKSLFRQALIDATLELANDLRDKKRVEYSAQHKKRMRSMGVAIGLSTRAKILISLIAAAILLTGCAVFRERIAGLFLTVGDGFVNVEGDVTPDAPKEIEHAYVPSYIPDGFTEVERVEEVFYHQIIWANDDNKQYLIFSQDTVYSSSHNIDTDHASTIQIHYSDFTVFKIESSNNFFYYWNYQGYVFALTSNYNIDDTTLFTFLGGLK